MTLAFDLKDTTTIVTEAVVNLMRDKYGMVVKANDIEVKFNTRSEFNDLMDRGPVYQVFSGMEVVIKQAKPMNRER
jgi:hypothetical protein